MSYNPHHRRPLTIHNAPVQRNQQLEQYGPKQSIKCSFDRKSKSTVSKLQVDESGSNAASEELISSWLCLPSSRFGIQYDLGTTKTSRQPLCSDNFATGMSILQLAVTRSPFEFKMQELKKVLECRFSNGATIVCVRELLEPQDPGFPHAQIALNFTVKCHVARFNQEQVARLRLLILNNRQHSALVSSLKCFSSFSSTRQVLDHFESFKHYYSKTRNHIKKLDAILALTISMCRFTGWIIEANHSLERSKMIEGLATRWKNLLATRTPADLDLDESFSFPAVLYLLQDFKKLVETAPTCGSPKVVFWYYPSALASEYVVT